MMGTNRNTVLQPLEVVHNDILRTITYNNFRCHITPRAPTWRSATPGRVEKCRPPSYGLKQSQAFQDGII